MGLDMYLYAKQFVSAASWGDEEDCKKVKTIAHLMKGDKFLMNDKYDLQFAELKLQVAYWRKANAIHQYFVNKCADGKDECQDIYVTKDHLEDVLWRCKVILQDKNRAQELLPTQSGFFFGSTDYDDWYYEDLERTIPMLEKILKNAPEEWEFEYKASW